MIKVEYKERMRKIKWATEHETGKRMGKKDLIEAQRIVMEIGGQPKMTQNKTKQELIENQYKNIPFTTWRGAEKKGPERLTVNLTNLIGKGVGKCRIMESK